MKNSSPEISDLVSTLLKELIDKRTVKQLGTSIDQHMSLNYQKAIESKFIQLKNEFNLIDYNEDSFLSIDEFYRFFVSKNNNVQKEEIQCLFELFDKDKNKKISLNEFIYIYILLEEKLKMKKESLKNVKDSLASKLEVYQNKLKDYQNEEYNSNGISNDNEIKLHIIEITNLKSLIMSPKCKVLINLMDKKGDIINEKETLLISGTSNPKFNEKFSFQVQDYNCYIKCILSDSDNLINDGYGSFVIKLTDLHDQTVHEMWYDVVGGSRGCRAHVSISFTYNNNKKYKDLISKTSLQIDKISQNIFQIENLIEKINQPFGLIMFNKVKEILDKNLLNKSENDSDYLGNSRISVYTDQRNSKFTYSESPNKFNLIDNREEDITRGKIGASELGIIPEEGDGSLINSNLLRSVKDEVTSTEGFLPSLGHFKEYFPKKSSILGKKSNQLIIIGVIISILNIIFGKIDIINLILYLFGCLIIFNTYGINGRFNNKKIFFYCLLAGVLLDIIWILFLNKEQEDQNSLFRAIVFGFTIFLMIIKITLCYLIKKRRR